MSCATGLSVSFASEADGLLAFWTAAGSLVEESLVPERVVLC